jgi:pimeloyl-ACP methyl ester carboxylesterase
VARGRGWLGFAAVAGGAVAGAVAEEVLLRRLVRGPDPERDESIGSVPGRTVWVKSPDGTGLYTRTYGPADAPLAIVFAHGITENHVIWHYVVRDLRTDGSFKLVAYDHRGHGKSGPAHGPEGTTTFDGHTLGTDLAAVIDQTTTGPVIVVGHSLGGMAALSHLIAEKTAGEDEGQRVAGAVIVCSTYTSELAGWRGRGKPLLERVGEAARRAAAHDPKRIERLRMGANDLTFLMARSLFGRNPSPRQIAVAFHMYETTPSQTLTAALDLFSYDVADRLSDIDVPVLIVAGERDVLTPPHLSREMAEMIPGAELVVFDDCGHMAPFERHAELVSQLRKFADRVAV